MKTEASTLGVGVGSLAGAAVGIGGVKLMALGHIGYGQALFVGIPLIQGFVCALVAQVGGPHPWGRSGWTATFSAILSGIVACAFAMEGIVCLVMAAPLILGLALLGAWLGWLVTDGPRAHFPQLSVATVAALGFALSGGPIGTAPESLGEVRTVWHVASPPERVWPLVLDLPELPEPDWWLFSLGVAHPVRTHTFVDSRRECVLSTGPMPEFVTARQENRRLAFRVVATPPSMREWNPFGEVRARHLMETYRGIEGEFLLTPEAGGTRIVARSSYGLRMAPFWYWRLWSDSVVRHVHERVVREIARRATRAR